MAKKRSNPNNPNGSSVLQMLLDCQTQGGWPADALKQMLEAAEADPKLCQNTDKLFESHRYPEKSIKWVKHRRDNELPRILTSDEKLVLDTLEQYMNQSNLLQIGSRMLSKITGLNDRTVRSALESLIDKGCIAIKIKGVSNRPSIYMVNPEIGTVGNSSKWVSESNFWILTGSVYELGKNNRLVLKDVSEPHRRWIELTSSRFFEVGTESIGSADEGTFQKYGILRFADKKTAPSLGDDEAAAGNDGSDSLDDSDLS